MKRNMLQLFGNVLIIMTVMVLASASFSYGTHPFEPWEDEVFVAIGEAHGPEAGV